MPYMRYIHFFSDFKSNTNPSIISMNQTNIIFLIKSNII